MQLLEKSILIALSGIPCMWESQNEVFRQQYFWSLFVFVDPRETRRAKKTPTETLKQNLIICIDW